MSTMLVEILGHRKDEAGQSSARRANAFFTGHSGEASRFLQAGGRVLANSADVARGCSSITLNNYLRLMRWPLSLVSNMQDGLDQRIKQVDVMVWFAPGRLAASGMPCPLAYEWMTAADPVPVGFGALFFHRHGANRWAIDWRSRQIFGQQHSCIR
ncbi:hypothetical protein [Burkholderia sp. 22PA0106]|uniref:hypothetical protein n=1 Tax=Burkholderia sp. 22PA0106 TaxID=3237371 RepID=UPI0039C3E830